MSLVVLTRKLSEEVAKLSFSLPTSHVYNPLEYAWAPHIDYLQKYGQQQHRVLLVGMNPGPFGMTQTGVPFGEIEHVKNWLKIKGTVHKPANEHPKRPVEGFACKRSEVSGRRLWGWAKERYHQPDRFFQHYFVHSYCPLVFMEKSGRNRTPDKLHATEKKPLFRICNQALQDLVHELQPKMVIGIGAFAERMARKSLGEKVPIGKILHPSPASPAANRGWKLQAEQQLKALNCLY